MLVEEKNIGGKRVVRFRLRFEADQPLLDAIRRRGTDLAKGVFAGAANNSGRVRPWGEVLWNCIEGVFAEYAWKHFLNRRAKRKAVRGTAFAGSSRSGRPTTLCGSPIKFSRQAADAIRPSDGALRPAPPRC